MQKNWSKNSWKNYKQRQQPEYSNKKKYQKILKTIEKYPPLVFTGEIEKLKNHIAEAGDGKRFILQGGDCAERFIDCNERAITNKIKILLQMSVILAHGAKKPIIRIGRIGGQYAKPRSKPTEIINDIEMPNFRGDIVNSFEPNAIGRKPNPERLLTSFYYSSITLNYIRAIIDGGFADLHHPYTWNLYSIEKTKKWPEYKKVVDQILDSISFMETFGGADTEKLGQIDFFTSHEGLLLGYEQSLTRWDKSSRNYYNMGAHMLWIGERTREPGGAHVEYFRGIANPIGIKIGPTCQKTELIKLIKTLNPNNEKGKITLIARLGASAIKQKLPELIKTIQKTQINVTWSCDPMHGNIISRGGGIKTNNFSTILEELKLNFNIHKKNKSYLAGVHFELTGEDVTECLGGAVDLTDEDLKKRYETSCDPRLNYAQSLEMAFLISEHLRSM